MTFYIWTIYCFVLGKILIFFARKFKLRIRRVKIAFFLCFLVVTKLKWVPQLKESQFYASYIVSLQYKSLSGRIKQVQILNNF